MNYKKGQKVKLKPYNTLFDKFPKGVGINEDMIKYFNKVVTVSEDLKNRTTFRINEDDRRWKWAYKWCEPIVSLPDYLFKM